MSWEDGLERVRAIAAAAARAGLTRLRVEEPEFGVELELPRTVVPASPLEQPAAPEHNGAPPRNGALPSARVILRADLVGIVRLARPLAVPGTLVDEGRQLAFVEALGMRTPVRATEPARITEVLVEDGQAVEYGQQLFALEPLGVP